ncbi:PREDICTED: interleukin-19 isoform X2 [Chinchilla lanigera]|uniref:interleukin-19 isoform X2 n=1 Tax=Chinchilla lanigera TaxID=34839 RepID=UPI000696AA6E|nr:PREDICTED: interleukin-19 isoform X2 [Chinchilla lanigera]
MKAQGVALWLLGTALVLCSMYTHGFRRCLTSVDMHHLEECFQEIKRAVQTKDIFPNITILSTVETLRSVKPMDVCCVTKNLLEFYMDRVFKDHQELKPQILRRISSIANSFLYMQKTLQQCLEVPSAATKSLGELDVFLAWIEKNHQETSPA